MAKKNNRGAVPFAALTHVGKVRALNEDSMLALPPLYAVADGLGGHQSGEVASALAIDALRDHAPKNPDTVALARAVQSANQAVITGIEKGAGREGMGTTMTAVMVKDGRAVFAQVGDSRAYLLRNRALSQVTEDHSVVAAMMRSGHLTAEEARTHPQRSVITRALGSDPNMSVDTFEVTVLRGDRILLCSDGLSTMIDDAHIEEILTNSLDPNKAAEELVEAAMDAGGSDNISVIVIDITEDQGANAAAMAAMKEKKPRSKLWLWALIWLALVATTVAGVFFATINYVEDRAYLSGEPGGYIYLNQGVPDTFMGRSWSFGSNRTVVEFDLLDTIYQDEIRTSPEFEREELALGRLETMVTRSYHYFDTGSDLINRGLLNTGGNTGGNTDSTLPAGEETP